MQPRPVSFTALAEQNAEHEQQEPDSAATPPPPKYIYVTLAGTLAHPMDAEQYYKSVHRELPADHATLQGWRQERGGDNEWCPEDNLPWEDTWKGTADTFPQAAATTYPGWPGTSGTASTLSLHSTAGNTATPSSSIPSTTI